MKRTQDPFVKILRQALDAQHVEGLEAALADLAQRFDLNSVDLANGEIESLDQFLRGHDQQGVLTYLDQARALSCSRTASTTSRKP